MTVLQQALVISTIPPMTQAATQPIAPDPQTASNRFISVDALRGVVMFTMLYVNDVAGVKGIPWWMKHFHPDDANGMTFVDWVFGAFLFVVGVSIPLAFANRLRRGEPTWKLASHVLTRTTGLLLLGVFMVNEETIGEAKMGWREGLWPALLFFFGILTFLAPIGRSPAAKKIGIGVRSAGFLGLGALAFFYRNEDGGRMTPQWWGILGLIGWAYLTASMLYLLFRHDRAWLVGCAALLIGLFLFDHTNFFEKHWAVEHLPFLHWLHGYIDFGEMLGSHAAIAMSGVVLGAMMIEPMSYWERLRGAFTLGLGLFVGALMVYPLYGINKNDATPAWCLICAGATCWLWILLALPIDGLGAKMPAIRWPFWLFIAGGSNVLLAYLIAPLWAHLRDLFGWDFYDKWGRHASTGIKRSLIAAALTLALVGVLKNVGVRLKL
jgi:heparan-alpha-glucosaminide N-acetyltransferase